MDKLSSVMLTDDVYNDYHKLLYKKLVIIACQ